jgi:hypothetical protein
MVLVAMAGLVWASGAGAVRISGVDPESEPIPGAGFACYKELKSDSYAAPTFTLQIQPGRTYVTPAGTGTFTVDPTETVQGLTWDSGPFAGYYIPSTVFFDDWGQHISVQTSDGEFQCYQSGARHQVALIDFGLKDPAVASYSCAERESGATGPAFDVLPGRAYSFGGASGAYTVNIMGTLSSDFSDVEFTSGPLVGTTAFYEQDGDTGLREMSLFTSPRLKCLSLGTPTPRPRFGAGRAPRPPAGSGGLNGLYASFQIDVANVCGGLCWRFKYFKPNGYVYMREPDVGPNDADCARVKPNGLPLCEVYRRRGSTIQIGEDAPASFAQAGKTFRINGARYRRVAPSPRLKLRGKYRSFSFIPAAGGTGGVAVERSFTFTPKGAFTRAGFAGGSFFPAPGTSGGSVVVTSGSANAGTYRVIGTNTLEFRYTDGSRRRAFFFLPDGPTKSARPESIHIAGSDYLAR